MHIGLVCNHIHAVNMGVFELLYAAVRDFAYHSTIT